MNNKISILALKEDDMPRVIFAKSRNEAGFGAEYDPAQNKFAYTVFIHSQFPVLERQCWHFEDFSSARNFASNMFAQDWEMLTWDFKTKRPCEEGGRECGSGECDTCKTLKPEVENDPTAEKGCGACGLAH